MQAPCFPVELSGKPQRLQSKPLKAMYSSRVSEKHPPPQPHAVVREAWLVSCFLLSRVTCGLLSTLLPFVNHEHHTPFPPALHSGLLTERKTRHLHGERETPGSRDQDPILQNNAGFHCLVTCIFFFKLSMGSEMQTACQVPSQV